MLLRASNRFLNYLFCLFASSRVIARRIKIEQAFCRSGRKREQSLRPRDSCRTSLMLQYGVMTPFDLG